MIKLALRKNGGVIAKKQLMMKALRMILTSKVSNTSQETMNLWIYWEDVSI